MSMGHKLLKGVIILILLSVGLIIMQEKNKIMERKSKFDLTIIRNFYFRHSIVYTAC